MIQSTREKSTIVIIDNKEVKLTNLDKIFWQKEGYTKRDLIEYYQRISPFILPYLADRPESLHRFPNGVRGKGFFQKNVESPPPYVKTVKIPAETENRVINYIVCQDLATLVYLANLGCIELNPWLSRTVSQHSPDYCVLDLDPVEIGFGAVVQTALVIHHLLEKASISHYVKTSGATGLHIYIPLKSGYTYEQSRLFAQTIASIVHQKTSSFTSLERLPEKRVSKVYLDYLQNVLGKTLSAPYCLRPRDRAPVSTPLLWEEINGKLDPPDFNIKTIFKRLGKIGDIWKPLRQEGVDLKVALDRLQKVSQKF
ncbi:MAG: non-homologous end-joining DNA ligase [Patescibacteria group bacterium]|nr:non-homologous end-joining DNA ligase [Patescibacteria group bacterium]